jgi:DNA-binding MarR family transcriptional regulator
MKYSEMKDVAFARPLWFDRALEVAMATKRSEGPRPFVDTYLSYLLAQASQSVAGEFHDRLKAWKISVAEWRVLSSLHGRDSLGISELAAMAIIKLPRMTAIVDRLVKAGMLERVASHHDRRRVDVKLTAKGQARLRPVIDAAKEHEKRLLADFTTSERATITRALDLIMRRSKAAERGTKVAIAPRASKTATSLHSHSSR